jgi:oligo-1,6-glucosidase
LNTLFHFELMGVDKVPHSPWGKWDRQTPDLLAIKAVTSKWQTMLDPVDGWNSLFLENHDMPRAVSRFGNDTTPELRDRSAKMLATWMLLLKGTPYIYQGQELGMPNAHFERIEDYRDIETLRAYEEMRDKRPLAELMAAVKFRSRDNGRTPMPWNDGPFNGFSDVTPWIGMNSACAVNVQSARNDACSVLHYYRRLIRFRKEQLTVLYGTYELILPNHTEIYAYVRRLAATVIVVICNFFGGTPVFEWPAQLLEEVKGAQLQLPFSNCERQVEVVTLTLQPFEACVFAWTL